MASDPRVVFEDNGKRYTIEKVDGGDPIYVKGHEKHHTLLICQCKNVQIVVQGKINCVSIDTCQKTQVVMEDVVSVVEVTNSKGIKFQITGSCPSASIDKTDGCAIYLMSDAAKKMEISTSKHSDVQVTYMEGDECIEKPIPEQFVHTVLTSSNTVESTVSSLYGGPEVAATKSTAGSDEEAQSVGFPDMPAPTEKDARIVFEDNGKRWSVENQKGGAPLILHEHQKNHTVSLYKIEDATVLIKGKVNAVSLDACKKTNVVLEHVIGVVEISNSKGVKFQICGACPSASIDKSDGVGGILMSEKAKSLQLSTSKHADVQLTWMNGDEPVEKPIPEQFVHTLQADGSVKSVVSSLYTS